MVTAQQRMIIASLEEQLSNKITLLNQLDGGNVEDSESVNRSRQLNIDLQTERALVLNLQEQISDMQEVLEEKEQLITEKNDCIRVRDEQILQLRSNMRRKSVSRSDSTSGQSQDVADSTPSSTVMEQTRLHLQEMQVSTESLTAELEDVRSRYDTAQKEIQTKDEQVLDLSEQLEHERRNVSTLGSRLANAESRLSSKEDLVNELQTELRQKEHRVSTLEYDSAECMRLRNQLINRESQIAELRRASQSTSDEVISLRRRVQEFQSQQGQGVARIEQLTSDLTSTRELYNRMQVERDEKTELHTQELHRRTEIQRTLDELRITQSSTEQEREAAHREMNRAQTELSNVTSQLVDLRTQLNASQLLVAQSRQEVPKDWILDRNEIVITDCMLGVGAWGNVKVGNFRGTDVAVKQIHHLILSPHNRRLFEREMSIASRCRHPCLLQFIGATNDNGSPLFVMEVLETDLRSLLSRQSLTHQECVRLGHDVIRALNYLHLSQPYPIIHRDVSSSNILLYHERDCWRGKLSDYGAANFMRLSMTRHPGALLYSAPEAGTASQSPKVF